MGLANRDYFREDDPYGSSWNPDSGKPMSLSTRLSIAFGVCFLIGVLLPDFVEYTALSVDALKSGRVWTLVTFGFVTNPRDIIGIIFDCYLIYAFGNMVERTMGSREYGLFLLATLLFAAAAHLITTGTPTIGPIHLLSALFLWLALTSPQMSVSLILFTAKLWAVVAFFTAWQLFASIGTWQVMQNNPGLPVEGYGTAFPSLLGALLFAFLYQRFGWDLDAVIGGRLDRLRAAAPGRSPSLARRVKQSKLKVFAEDEPAPAAMSAEDASAEVDRILQKIHEEGEASLTKKERSLLKRESQRLRKRQ